MSRVPGIPCEARWPPGDCLCNPASSACPAHRSASGAPAYKKLDWEMVSMQGNCRLHASGSVLRYEDPPDNCKFQGGVVEDVKFASPGKLCLTSPLNVSSSWHASSTALPSFVLELRESKAPPGTCPVLKGRQVDNHKLSTGDSSFHCTGQEISPSSLPHLSAPRSPPGWQDISDTGVSRQYKGDRAAGQEGIPDATVYLPRLQRLVLSAYTVADIAWISCWKQVNYELSAVLPAWMGARPLSNT